MQKGQIFKIQVLEGERAHRKTLSRQFDAYSPSVIPSCPLNKKTSLLNLK